MPTMEIVTGTVTAQYIQKFDETELEVSLKSKKDV